MSLETQIQIYSVDTGNFYDTKESHLHWRNHKLRSERNQLVNGGIVRGADGKVKRTILGTKDIEAEFAKYGIEADDLAKIAKGEYDFSSWDEFSKELERLGDSYRKLKGLIAIKNEKIRESKERLLKLLSNKVEENIRSGGKHHIRKLSENQVSNKNVISVFDSYFTRTIGAKPDELCEDFMVVQVYYFDVIKDLIYHGFMYKGEKYVYFTSSAGQIRTKKTVFIKESVWKKYEKSIMCGLTIDDINAKGGNNPNKHLAYLALANSATDVWEEFDIDKTIVIDDFETDVFGTYDLVDDSDYSIKRVSDYVPIPHTDGAGMMLPCMGKNRMIRLPWVKGLLGVFDFVKFIKMNGCSSVIKDIYGKEHDVVAEDIRIIFTKSQFKMWKYYESWEQYKEMYKRYGCTAGITNVEEDRIKDATINYQMLQTLTDITDDEIMEIANQSIDRLKNLTSSIENVKAAFGVTPYNTNRNAFQKSIDLYPDLLNDEYVKSQLRDIKDSMVKKYRSGKLQVNGKYTFILPDFYAACEHWFLGEENPRGLLDDGEVFCWLFRKSEKLDCLRSPHLYVEHAVRNNVAWREIDSHRRDFIREWYCTDAVYTSCHDFISKILQFDVDGDKSLVVSDRKLIEVAERNIEKYDIVPLYYNMKKAEPVRLDNASIYNGLNAAFTGGNIGIYSNNISKIWNSEVFVSGTDEEKKEAVKIVKLLCMENNFVIDYAKTLYKPERPSEIGDIITSHTNCLLPHFFMYAKDKNDNQVTDVNGSFVNKLEGIVKNTRINCRKLGLAEIDYRKMLSDSDNDADIDLNNPMIERYCELNSQHRFILDSALRIDKTFSVDTIRKSQFKNNLKYKNAIDDIKRELSQYGYDDVGITDMLVKYLYGIKKSKHKIALWMCYGDIIYDNLKRNIGKSKISQERCEVCGEWFDVSKFNSAKKMCDECYKEHRREDDKIRKQESSEFGEFKTIVCCDCNKEFEVGVKDTRTERCDTCTKEHKKQLARLRKQRQREKKNVSRDQIPQTL